MRKLSGESFWLIPDGVRLERYESVIRTLALEVGGPEFFPHVSIIPSFVRASEERSVEWVADQCTEIARRYGPIELRMGALGFGQDDYDSAFLKVGASPPLFRLHRECLKIFEPEHRAPYRPHLSLVYGSFPASLRPSVEREASRIAGEALSWKGKELVWVSLEGEPGNWRILDRFPLTGRSQRLFSVT